ncbi:uncharacterized protein LOC100831188 [Anopheles sinensis]|uniref:Uncharacterized protein LOC100831188 n=1 Tax=Anopheles sinensis TaxID=74873 RepID=A0A084VCQ4_ANOSI|nr:uncharacterized protein LOC100831188 [Anopheles sinensis]
MACEGLHSEPSGSNPETKSGPKGSNSPPVRPPWKLNAMDRSKLGTRFRFRYSATPHSPPQPKALRLHPCEEPNRR